jgi:molybdopterin converting factor small subunit
MMMEIEVELFGQLALDKQRKQVLQLDHPLEVREVAGLLDLNLEQIGLITINGVQSEMEDVLSSDCRLCFFPPMSGG